MVASSWYLYSLFSSLDSFSYSASVLQLGSAMKGFDCPGLVHMSSPHWMNYRCLGVKYSDFVQTGPFGHLWPTKGVESIMMMAALPLNHVG